MDIWTPCASPLIPILCSLVEHTPPPQTTKWENTQLSWKVREIKFPFSIFGFLNVLEGNSYKNFASFYPKWHMCPWAVAATWDGGANLFWWFPNQDTIPRKGERSGCGQTQATGPCAGVSKHALQHRPFPALNPLSACCSVLWTGWPRRSHQLKLSQSLCLRAWVLAQVLAFSLTPVLWDDLEVTHVEICSSSCLLAGCQQE